MHRILAFLMVLGLVATTLRADETNIIRFTGKVLDANAKPLAGVSVMINRVSGAGIAGDITRLKTTTSSNGTYELPLALEATDQPHVECELWFSKKNFVRTDEIVTVPTNKSATKSLDVALEPGLVLSGVIRSALQLNGEPPELSLYQITGGEFERYDVTDTNGAFEIYVPPGEYTFKVHSQQPFEVTRIRAGSTNLVIAPTPFGWNEENVGKVFDGLWREMDRQYSYFFLKTNMDWDALGKEFRPQAIRAKNVKELADVLQKMLEPLHDLHVWLEWPGGGAPSYRSSYTFNGNGKITRNAIEDPVPCGKYALVGRSKPDGFGYFLMLRQGNATAELVKQALATMEKLRDAPGFIVDLRSANGGSEPLAQEVASWFCGRETVYAKSKYRNGASHTAFAKANARSLRASTNAYTKPVVCIIGPGAVSSGEGFVKMMKALPHVTTVGMPTRGASGNPKAYALGTTGVTVMFSRWADLLPNGETFEGRGIPPEVLVDEPQSSYVDRDPTLEKAINVLQEKVEAGKNPKK